MYGFTILAIIFSILTLLAILLLVLPEPMYRRQQEKLKYTDPDGFHETTFYGGAGEVKRLSKHEPELLKQLIRRKKIERFWYKLYMFSDEVKISVLLVSIFLAIIFIPISIFTPVTAIQEVNYWQEFVVMVEDTISSANEYETVAIADKVIQYNSWLVEARTSQEVWKNWSMYYNIDLSELNYIKLR
jgi:hypothetical protein